MQKKSIYKVVFVNQGKVYEIYAKEVAQSDMFGFIEIGGFVFGEKSAVVIDPSEEKLKSEFQEVKRTYVPMHSVIRIDEVKQEGTAKITSLEGKSDQVVSFPGSYYSPSNKPKGDS
jgi:hypothetical protein